MKDDENTSPDENHQLEDYIKPEFTFSVAVEGCASSSGEPPDSGPGRA